MGNVDMGWNAMSATATIMGGHGQAAHNSRQAHQRDLILDHLMRGHTITPLEAYNLFGCMRLAARIHELRKSGHEIEMTKVTVGDTTYASYRMIFNGQIQIHFNG